MITYDAADWYWIIGGDESQLYASARAVLVKPDDAVYAAWGGVPSRIASMGELIDVLRERGVPPYHRVAKSTIISRLTDDQLTKAISIMTVRQQERWRAPDQPAVNADDPETLAIVQAIGADPAVILAPS